MTLLYIAQNIPSKSIDEIKTYFNSLDKNGDGRLSHDELYDGLKKGLGPKEIMSPEHFQGLLNILDADKSGFVEYSEFVAAYLSSRDYLTEAHLEATFKAMDTDNSGTLSKQEILEALSSANLAFDKEALLQTIERQTLMTDGIDYEQFKRILQ